ncbi:hypothetical protein ACFL21_00305 [Patescibacteria group bacterium]
MKPCPRPENQTHIHEGLDDFNLENNPKSEFKVIELEDLPREEWEMDDEEKFARLEKMAVGVRNHEHAFNKYPDASLEDIERIMAIVRGKEISTEESEKGFQRAIKKLEEWFENRKSNGEFVGACLRISDINDDYYTSSFDVESLTPNKEETENEVTERALKFLEENPDAEPIFDNEIRRLDIDYVDELYMEVKVYFGDILIFFRKTFTHGLNSLDEDFELFGEKVRRNHGRQFLDRLDQLQREHFNFTLNNSIPDKWGSWTNKIKLEFWMKHAKFVDPGNVEPENMIGTINEILDEEHEQYNSKVKAYKLSELIQGRKVEMEVQLVDPIQNENISGHNSFIIEPNTIVVIDVVHGLNKFSEVFICTDSETNKEIFASLFQVGDHRRILREVEAGDEAAKHDLLQQIPRRTSSRITRILRKLI